MAELSKKYHNIMKEVEKRITDERELIFVKDKLSEVSLIFMELVSEMNSVLQDKIEVIEANQKRIEKRLCKIQNTIDGIEEEFYDEIVEVEIMCPYCNNEFVADIRECKDLEVECPECHNMLEIDLDE